MTRSKRPVAWTPFEPAVLANGDRVRKLYGDAMATEAALGELFMNSRYVVLRRDMGEGPWGPLVWLSIRRQDRGAIRDWRDMQRIKNELVGPECEGMELYPAEGRLVDTSNQFHLWVLAVPGKRFPFGFDDRLVMEGRGKGGSQQRPFEHRPSDLTTEAEALAGQGGSR